MSHTTHGGNYGIDAAINRPTGLAKGNSGSPGQDLVTYDRMGSGRAAQVAYPEPSLQRDYADSGTSGYAGWDRFGRVVDHRWRDTPGSGGSDVVRHQHDYDRASNRLNRENTVASGGRGRSALHLRRARSAGRRQARRFERGG